MAEQFHILIVDDDPKIRNMLRRYLTGEGFRVSEAPDGGAMRKVLDGGAVDLVLLDLVMPLEDGLSLARYIRQRAATPIIVLTGKSDLIDRVAGLEAGADDYIAKPFHLREVLARIRSVLRRAPSAGTQMPPATARAEDASGGTLSFLGWRLDTVRRELRNPDGDIVALTSAEFGLLHVFLRNPNRVLSRDQLMDLVKGREWAAFDRSIDTQVVRLRRKIERDPRHPELIKTVRGAGYVLAAAVSSG